MTFDSHLSLVQQVTANPFQQTERRNSVVNGTLQGAAKITSTYGSPVLSERNEPVAAGLIISCFILAALRPVGAELISFVSPVC